MPGLQSSILLPLLLNLFNGLFSRTTWVSWHQKRTILDFTGARDNEVTVESAGSFAPHSRHNHASISPVRFLQAWCPLCRPTKASKHWRQKLQQSICTQLQPGSQREVLKSILHLQTPKSPGKSLWSMKVLENTGCGLGRYWNSDPFISNMTMLHYIWCITQFKHLGLLLT